MEVDKQRIAALVKKIQSGDDSAFDELYKLTSERAYFVALEFTKNNQDAEDILQESYVKALSKINELEKAETFSSWLNQIVANKSKDFLKKKKPMLFEAEENEVLEVIPDEDTDFSPEENCFDKDVSLVVTEGVSDDEILTQFKTYVTGKSSLKEIYNIRFVDSEGNIVQPAEGKKVTVRIKAPALESNTAKYYVTHRSSETGSFSMYKNDLIRY